MRSYCCMLQKNKIQLQRPQTSGAHGRILTFTWHRSDQTKPIEFPSAFCRPSSPLHRMLLRRQQRRSHESQEQRNSFRARKCRIRKADRLKSPADPLPNKIQCRFHRVLDHFRARIFDPVFVFFIAIVQTLVNSFQSTYSESIFMSKAGPEPGAFVEASSVPPTEKSSLQSLPELFTSP